MQEGLKRKREKSADLQQCLKQRDYPRPQKETGYLLLHYHKKHERHNSQDDWIHHGQINTGKLSTPPSLPVRTLPFGADQFVPIFDMVGLGVAANRLTHASI